MEKTLIVEFVKDCKLVREGSEENGHDCWGNLEFNSYKFIYLDGKEQRLADHWWVIHDGKEVLEFRIPALPPDIEYQERAIDFAYGWSVSTEKDYNNQKAGFEYRMILKSPPSQPSKQPPSEASEQKGEDIKCPFCDLSGFDKIGLKYHLRDTPCQQYLETPLLTKVLI